MSNPATKHPDFGPGNFARVTHGAHSDRKINPLAEELRDAVIADRPDLRDHLPAVWAWARCEARIMLIEDWFIDHPMITEDGKVTEPARFLNQLEKTVVSLRQKLGLDPMSQARLATERAQATLHSFDINQLLDAGVKALDARE